MNTDFIGEIVREPDPPGLSRQSWIDLIREHPNLDPPRPCEGINPFTKKPMVIQPRTDVARVIIGAKEVGSMSWAEDDSNLINVFGDSSDVVPLAQEIARTLGGRFNAATGNEQRKGEG